MSLPQVTLRSAVLLVWALAVAGVAKDALAASSGTLVCTPSTLNFGNVGTGQTKTLSAQLSNTGGISLTITRIIVEASSFRMSNINLPVTIAPGKTIQFSVTFSPSTASSSSGSIVFFSSNATDSSLFVNLSGAGAATTALTANPTNQSFGSVKVGTSTMKSQTVTNAGGTTLSIGQASVTGSGFRTSGLSLPLTLTPGQSFTFSVVYAPTSTGNASGSLSLVFGSSNPALTVPLSGTGTAGGQLSVSPATVSFGSVVVGATSTAPVSLSATGASVTVQSATLSSTEFGLSGITFPVTLAAGSSVSFNVTFTPQASGAASGNISYASSAPGTTTTEAVSGTGTAASGHQVVLSWSDSGSGVTGYNIYRSNASSGPYTKINPALNPTTTYTDATVQGGTTYYYETTAVNASGAESRDSNVVTAVIPSP